MARTIVRAIFLTSHLLPSFRQRQPRFASGGFFLLSKIPPPSGGDNLLLRVLPSASFADGLQFLATGVIR